MPIVGNRYPSEIAYSKEPIVWEPMDSQEIIQTLVTLASKNAASPSEKFVTQISNATEALNAAAERKDVFGSVDPYDREMIFAVGPRFVPEQDLPFSLDEVTGEASEVLMGAGLEYDLSDDKPAAAIREGLLSMGLLEESPEGDLFDSFSEDSKFKSEILVALESWEMGLSDEPASSEEKQELVEGMTSQQLALVAEQLQAFLREDWTLDTFLSQLTPSKARDFVRQKDPGAETDPEPMKTFLARLDGLASKYEG